MTRGADRSKQPGRTGDFCDFRWEGMRLRASSRRRSGSWFAGWSRWCLDGMNKESWPQIFSRARPRRTRPSDFRSISSAAAAVGVLVMTSTL